VPSYAHPMVSQSLGAALICAIAVIASDAGAGSPQHTAITVWSAVAAPPGTYGGQSYGSAPTTGALITEQHEVDVGGGEVHIAGIATTIDPASVQLRDLTEPSATVSEQRFVPGATTPTEVLTRHIGDAVTVVTAKGDIAGVLRAVDEQSIVVEVGTGDQRHLQVMRREGYVQDVRLPAGPGLDRPSLVWKVSAKKPGKHSVELSYRADAMTWSADYSAVIDEAARTIDFTAWATVKNATGAGFDAADLTLISNSSAGPPPANPFGATLPPQKPTTPQRFVVPTSAHLGASETVQVQLMPPRIGAKTRTVVMFEAMPDPSAAQSGPNTDCNQFNGIGMGSGKSDVTVELDVPNVVLPDGRVRLFRKQGKGALEVLTEDQLRTGSGSVRIRLAGDNDVTGERRALTCNYDEQNRTIHERVEVKLESKSKQALDVVVREYLWRSAVWHLEAEDQKGAHAGPQAEEYRVRVPANGKQTVTYTVVYTW
jgi:hypothetical protein